MQHACWISPPGEKPDNYTFLARKPFTLGRLPPQATLRISADSRYAVYLNGQFVGHGPVRGTHRRYFYDSYIVRAFLRPGTNWIAAEVHCPVRATYVAAPHTPALLAEIEGVLATDASWQVRPHPSHRNDSLLYTLQIGFSEWKDLRAEPAGWTTGNDGDGGWLPAQELGNAEDFGGRITVPRPIASLATDVFSPSRVVSCGAVPNAGDATDNADYATLMQGEMHYQPNPPSFTDLSNLATGGGVVTVQPSPWETGAFLILDFGREVFGNLVFDVEGPAGAILDVAHDEGLDNGRLAVRRFDYRFADRFVLREGRQTIAQRLHNRGFRYLQLVFRRFAAPIRLHSLRLVSRNYSQRTEATFECDDPFLNQLWAACANTVRQCCSDTFMDCIWREQAFWLNDQVATSLFYLAATGDRAFAAHNLRVGADGALPNGLLPFVYPSDCKTQNPLMPAFWTVTLSDYLMHTGDLALTNELASVMEKALALFDTWRDSDGLVADQPDQQSFLDWGYRAAVVALKGKVSGHNMLIAAAYKRAAGIEGALGNSTRADEYTRKSRAAIAAVNARFWDAEKGYYADCTEPNGTTTYSQHPLALGLAFDLLDEPQRSTAVARLLDPSLIRAELFFQHFVLFALARHARTADALGVIRALWGRMIELGSDTIWESIEGRSAFFNCGSLCHAFSCAPLYFLQTTLLGVRPLQPGFTEFTLEPQSLGLQQCRGRVPTPHGNISVEWLRQADGFLSVEADIPEHTCACVPDRGRLKPGHHSLRMDGQSRAAG